MTLQYLRKLKLTTTEACFCLQFDARASVCDVIIRVFMHVPLIRSFHWLNQIPSIYMKLLVKSNLQFSACVTMPTNQVLPVTTL